MFNDLCFAQAQGVGILKNIFLFSEKQMEEYGAEYPLITDDNPVLEFSSAKTIIQEKDPTRVIQDINKFLGENSNSWNVKIASFSFFLYSLIYIIL